MVNINISNGGGEGVPPVAKGSGRADLGRGTPFVLKNPRTGASFAPRYFPETLRRTKEHELDRQLDFCGGENVTDMGAKNWDIHVVGRVLSTGVKFFDETIEKTTPLLLTSASWSGEVLVASAELEGPIAWDPQADQYQWRYTLDVVSTGRDEPGEVHPDGILDDGVVPGEDVGAQLS